MMLNAIEQKNTTLIHKLLSIPGINSIESINAALELSCKLGYSDGVKCLLESCAEFDLNNFLKHDMVQRLVTSGYVEVLNVLKQFGASLNNTDRNGHNILHTATVAGNRECVLFALASYCHIDSVNNNRETALILAIKGNKFDIVNLLLENGANLDIANRDGWTALHFAAYRGLGVNLLLSKGAVPNVYSNDSHSPLELAAIEGFTNIVIGLVDAGAKPNTRHPNRKTALHIMSMKGHLDAVKHLVMYGADIESIDVDNMTALAYAIDHKRHDVAKWLLQVTSAKDCQCMELKTCPLFLAVKHNSPILVDILSLGYDSRHLKTVLDSCPGSHMSLTAVCREELQYIRAVPKSLKILSRLEIRSQLGVSALALKIGLEYLNIPQLLSNYIYCLYQS